MVEAFAALLLFQLAGELLVQVTGLPLPGPVFGMVLLFAFLALRRRVAAPLRETSLTLLRHLGLLFVPAGAGVMLHAARVAEEWLAIIVALLLSTLAGVAATALVTAAAMRRLGGRGD